MEYVDYFKDMNTTNELYKKNPQHFFDDNGIDQDKFFKDYKEYQLIPIAEKVLEEVENIHTNVIGIFINPQDDITYPVKSHDWLIDFRDFCFDDNGNFLLVEKQNNSPAPKKSQATRATVTTHISSIQTALSFSSSPWEVACTHHSVVWFIRL